MHTDYHHYRAHVSIVQVAEALGYVHNPKAGRNPVEYTHTHQANVLISNPSEPSRQVYFTRNEDANRGDVIEFVKHRLPLFNIAYNNPIHGIKKVLDGFVNIPFDLTEKFGSTASRYTPPNFRKEDYQITAPTLSDLAYLSRERKLDEKTLSVFAPHIAMVQSKLYKYNFRNIGFAYRTPGEDTIKGYELVNYNYKSFAPGTDKSHAVWLASLAPKGVIPLNVIFAESAIDAMSFYQLYRHRYNFAQSLFVSIGGALSHQQAEQVIQAYPHAKLLTAFDSDLNGKLYAIRLAAIKAQQPLTVSRQQERNDILFETAQKKFTLSMDELSLAAFKKESGLRVPIKEHKSTAKDFNEVVQQRYHAQHHEKIPEAAHLFKR